LKCFVKENQGIIHNLRLASLLSLVAGIVNISEYCQFIH